ncbi:dTDP-4-dehydrorhamnose reductase [Acetitomaculum ruminis DSM 5522]|uniref:dTDP-4-dehydrorhamnose reductase n=1 Tax=Acetitomaculum ruminis DSM 5522 TaxID=1120918 RepID=A0A1I0YIJ8_9FIRM|nr:dTDP-4-dehydrorhamnose reductase [Acetitomaculum ruminis]SFB13164.1 dTDP-4-dehydrorhamnose reductase [Acetitomaculum ruminis DSM 5522]
MAKKLFITGCNGQLGKAINNLYSQNTDYQLVNTDMGDLDISNIDEVMERIKSEKPDVIINCAAFTAVDACETEIDAAYKANALGPRNLSIAATEVDAKLMHVSTDYVFDGKLRSNPYTEFDQVNPQGMYGKTKLAGENFVKEFAKKHFIVRTAWLYGDGKNFVKTMLKLSESHDEVSVVCDQTGSPTSAKELALSIAALIDTDNYGTFHGTCEGSCNWAEFTQEIFRLKSKNTKVNHITSDQYPSPVKRPEYSVLENYMFKLTTNHTYAHWKDAIKEYLEEN